jgi:hypothetical protein
VISFASAIDLANPGANHVGVSLWEGHRSLPGNTGTQLLPTTGPTSGYFSRRQMAVLKQVKGLPRRSIDHLRYVSRAPNLIVLVRSGSALNRRSLIHWKLLRRVHYGSLLATPVSTLQPNFPHVTNVFLKFVMLTGVHDALVVTRLETLPRRR